MSNQQPGGINTAATICPPPTYLPFCPSPADGGGQAQAQGITFLNYCPQTGLPIVCPPNQAQQGPQAQAQGITFFNYCPPTNLPVFCPPAPAQQAQPQSTFLCTFSGSCATAPQQGQQAQPQGITFFNYCPQTGYPIVCPPNQDQPHGQQAQPQGITFFNYCPQTGFPTVCPPAQQAQQAQPQSTFLCTFSGSCATAPQQGQQAQAQGITFLNYCPQTGYPIVCPPNQGQPQGQQAQPQSTFLCTFSGSCATAPQQGQQAQAQGITFFNYCPQTGFPTVCPPSQAQQGQQAQPQSTFLCTFIGSCATRPQQGQQAQAQGITFLNYCPQTGYPIVCPPNQGQQAQQGQQALPQSTFLCTFSGNC